MKPFIFLMSMILLAGCVTAGVKVDEASLTRFKKGRTTYAQVIAGVGTPTANTILPDGRRMLMYTWVDARAQPQNFIPLVDAAVGGAYSPSFSPIIFVAGDGALDTYSASQSQYGIGRGLESGSSPGRIPDQPRTTPVAGGIP